MSILEYSMNYMESELLDILETNTVPFVRFLYSGLKMTWEAGANNYSPLLFSSPLGLESSFLLRL